MVGATLKSGVRGDFVLHVLCVSVSINFPPTVETLSYILRFAIQYHIMPLAIRIKRMALSSASSSASVLHGPPLCALCKTVSTQLENPKVV